MCFENIWEKYWNILTLLSLKKKLLKNEQFLLLSPCFQLYSIIVLLFKGSFKNKSGMFSKSSAADLLYVLCRKGLKYNSYTVSCLPQRQLNVSLLGKVHIMNACILRQFCSSRIVVFVCTTCSKQKYNVSTFRITSKQLYVLHVHNRYIFI